MSSQVKASILIGFPSFQTSTEVLQGKAGNFQLILYGTEELESEGGERANTWGVSGAQNEAVMK